MQPDQTYRPKLNLLTSSLLIALLSLGGCSDNDDDSSSDTTDTNNTAPIANAGTDQSTPLNNAVTLDGSGSSDADGDTLSYSWNLTAVPAGSHSALSAQDGSTTSLTPDIAGAYTLTLTVDDGAGGTDTDQVIISATETDTGTENTAPQAEAGVNQSVSTGSGVTLDASGSSDADGDTLTYDWATVTLPGNSTAVLSSTAAVSPTFTADVAGTYVFQVTVSDGAATATDQVTITVTTSDNPITGTDSTDGVECDYSYNAFNDSASVATNSIASWSCGTEERVLAANGIPDHAVGTFPNGANPNTISAQDVAATFTLTPVQTDTATELGGPLGPQGYVLNGVKVDAGTGGSCTDYGDSCSGGDNSGPWSLEALGYTSFDFFGADDNNAHVQPDGTYHYHGLPEGFFQLRGGGDSTMTLVAWASDGFPIYARYGYTDPNDASSAIKVVTGSYQHITNVSDTRPPVAIYEMGMFRQDWEYVAGSGDLDECNGRFGVTPEFPNGIYHYYATDSYPYFQRCVKGEVESAGGPGAGGPPPR